MVTIYCYITIAFYVMITMASCKLVIIFLNEIDLVTLSVHSIELPVAWRRCIRLRLAYRQILVYGTFCFCYLLYGYSAAYVFAVVEGCCITTAIAEHRRCLCVKVCCCHCFNFCIWPNHIYKRKVHCS